MFALTDTEEDFGIVLKCDPLWATELREQHPAIKPGYHMNKKYWNSIHIDGSLSDTFIKKLTDHSYELVAVGLKKTDRLKLKQMGNKK